MLWLQEHWATMRAIDKSPSGGITGFQAGCIMWEFIRKWYFSSNKCGLKIVDYDNLLYPQKESSFDRVLSKDIWENVQNQAKELIADYERELEQYNQRTEEYPDKMQEFLKAVDNYRRE